LNEGKPTKECAQAISDSWGNSKSFKNYGKTGGILAIVLGAIMMLALFCSLPLCRGFGKDADMRRQYKYQDAYV
jgi:Na+-driven multidrug efflux pump